MGDAHRSVELSAVPLVTAVTPWVLVIAGASALLAVAGLLLGDSSRSVFVLVGAFGMVVALGTLLVVRRIGGTPMLVLDEEGLRFRQPIGVAAGRTVLLTWAELAEVEMRTTRVGKDRFDEHLILRLHDRPGAGDPGRPGSQLAIPVGVLPLSADELVGTMRELASPHTFDVVR